MLRLFLGNQLLVLLLIPLFTAAYLLCNLYTEYFEVSATLDLGFWGSQPLVQIANFVPWISGLVVCINALALNYQFNVNGFLDKNSYIVALVYVVLLSYYRSFYVPDGLLIAQSLLLFSLAQIFKLEYAQEGRARAFNIGFFAGLAATFHPPIAFILPFLWVMITRIRPFVFREMILCMIGMAVPLIYAYSFNLYYGHEINFNFIESTSQYTQKELIFLGSLCLFALLVLSGWIGSRNRMNKSSIRFRKNTNVISLFLLYCFGLGTIDWIFFQQYEWFSFMVIPISLLLPFSYLNVRYSFISYLLFYAAFGFSVIKFFL